VALVDGSFFSAAELPGRSVEEIGHPMIGTTMDLLQDRVDAGDLEVYFIHLNHSNPALLPDSDARREIERRGFHVAVDGLEIAL
jgi:pyrroloquinoline quinone biosynthesis protein B